MTVSMNGVLLLDGHKALATVPHLPARCAPETAFLDRLSCECSLLVTLRTRYKTPGSAQVRPLAAAAAATVGRDS